MHVTVPEDCGAVAMGFEKLQDLIPAPMFKIPISSGHLAARLMRAKPRARCGKD